MYSLLYYWGIVAYPPLFVNRKFYFPRISKNRLFPSGFPKEKLAPVAVPDKIFGLTLILDFIDRCHSLCSLNPPPAAVASLPGEKV